jgi:hypothetical protein
VTFDDVLKRALANVQVRRSLFKSEDSAKRIIVVSRLWAVVKFVSHNPPSQKKEPSLVIATGGQSLTLQATYDRVVVVLSCQQVKMTYSLLDYSHNLGLYSDNEHSGQRPEQF